MTVIEYHIDIVLLDSVAVRPRDLLLSPTAPKARKRIAVFSRNSPCTSMSTMSFECAV